MDMWKRISVNDFILANDQVEQSYVYIVAPSQINDVGPPYPIVAAIIISSSKTSYLVFNQLVVSNITDEHGNYIELVESVFLSSDLGGKAGIGVKGERLDVSWEGGGILMHPVGIRHTYAAPKGFKFSINITKEPYHHVVLDYIIEMSMVFDSSSLRIVPSLLSPLYLSLQ